MLIIKIIRVNVNYKNYNNMILIKFKCTLHLNTNLFFIKFDI